MNDDRSGIDAFRRSIDEVAATLPSPRLRRQRVAAGGAALVVAAAALATWVAVRVERPVAPPSDRLGVEVKVLRVGGRDVAPRVVDVARAGTIVVAPRGDLR